MPVIPPPPQPPPPPTPERGKLKTNLGYAIKYAVYSLKLALWNRKRNIG